ncbi:hypothetical protein [Kitasatospora sp. NPDC047058]|uniref:hypothetical protein n=1 Tax=Kitasatospora sp. NPDC047058 TaxID=3155620 RepID=UPI0033D74B25
MSYYETTAESAAGHAVERFGPDRQTEAIGEGLGAIAFAILELARAVKDLAEAQQQ